MATILTKEDFDSSIERLFLRFENMEKEVKHLRRQLGEKRYSAAEIAKKLNVTPATVYDYIKRAATDKHYLEATKTKNKVTITGAALEDFLKRNSNDGIFYQERLLAKAG